MLPLEKTLKQPGSEPARRRARPIPERRPREHAPEPAAPRRFRVIDARSRTTLADDVSMTEAIDVLRDVEQQVDVSVYVWEPKGDAWRLLTRRELSLLWDRRD